MPLQMVGLLGRLYGQLMKTMLPILAVTMKQLIYQPTLERYSSHSMLRLTLVLLTMTFLLTTFAIRAQNTNFTWSGASNTDWSDNANWAGGTAPSSATDVVIVPSVTNHPVVHRRKQ